jgi:hypothetical protein
MERGMPESLALVYTAVDQVNEQITTTSVTCKASRI